MESALPFSTILEKLLYLVDHLSDSPMLSQTWLFEDRTELLITCRALWDLRGCHGIGILSLVTVGPLTFFVHCLV